MENIPEEHAAQMPIECQWGYLNPPTVQGGGSLELNISCTVRTLANGSMVTGGSRVPRPGPRQGSHTTRRWEMSFALEARALEQGDRRSIDDGFLKSIPEFVAISDFISP